MDRDVHDPLYWIEKYTPTVFAVARAIVESSGSDPDGQVPGEGPAPIWTDNVKAAKSAIARTAVMLRANGYPEAATFLAKEAE